MESFIKDYDKIIKKQRTLETNDPLDRLIAVVNEAKEKIRAGVFLQLCALFVSEVVSSIVVLKPRLLFLTHLDTKCLYSSYEHRPKLCQLLSRSTWKVNQNSL